MGGSNKGGKSEADRARDEEQKRQARIRKGTKDIGSLFNKEFNKGFFRDRRNAYLNYANPQLEDQYGNAQKELTFALTRGGLLDSSVRGQKAGELQQQYDTHRQQIADQAVAGEAQARNQVEGARADLIATLNATGDAKGAVNSAMSRAAALSKPEAFSPLAQLFEDFTAGLGAYAARDRANAYAGGNTNQAGGRSASLFAPNRNAVKYTS